MFRVDTNGDGVISAVEGDIDMASDGFPNNARLFLPATAFNRFAVTREINDGLLATHFAPSQRAGVLSGDPGADQPGGRSVSRPRHGRSVAWRTPAHRHARAYEGRDGDHVADDAV